MLLTAEKTKVLDTLANELDALKLELETELEEDFDFDMEQTLLEERRFYINDKIGEETLLQIAPLIDYYNIKDKGIKRKNRKPIHLVLGTYGGELYEALGIVDAIKSSKTPVHVHALGKAMSAGFFIWAAADKRTMGKRAVLMYHQVRGNVSGTLEEMEQAIKETKKSQKALDKMIEKSLGIKRSKLTKYNKSNQDWYLNHKKAKKLGLLN